MVFRYFCAVDNTSGSVNDPKHIDKENDRDSFNTRNQTADDSTNNLKKWVGPKPFESESTADKVSLILKWIFGSKSHEKIVSGEKIANITTLLERLQFNSYLRLFEIDMNIMKVHMTENSWILFTDFKKKRENDKWKCPVFFFLHRKRGKIQVWKMFTLVSHKMFAATNKRTCRCFIVHFLYFFFIM